MTIITDRIGLVARNLHTISTTGERRGKAKRGVPTKVRSTQICQRPPRKGGEAEGKED